FKYFTLWTTPNIEGSKCRISEGRLLITGLTIPIPKKLKPKLKYHYPKAEYLRTELLEDTEINLE
ncbi:hypothetical protein, partial [Desulfobacula sp.]|uniref:hypothetical protein n=1 Tax=Desulfobacula sp. TaxID=2593537 RepID=UPI0039B905F1